LLGVVEAAFEIASSLRPTNIVRDHFAEVLRIGEQPAV
jgi:hypothetical protein